MSNHHRTYFEYFTPGVYDYPVTHSAASTPSAYNWEPISSNWCTVPVQNSVTYVAGPLGGVINYVSDVESHLALPTRHTLATNLIYTTLTPVQEDEEVEDQEEETTSYQLQSVQNFHQVHFANDDVEEYEFIVPPNRFCLALPPREGDESEPDPDQAGETQRKSTVEITDVSGSKATRIKARVIPKRKKRTHKRVYKDKQGYLVEEPTSELSDEEGATP